MRNEQIARAIVHINTKRNTQPFSPRRPAIVFVFWFYYAALVLTLRPLGADAFGGLEVLLDHLPAQHDEHHAAAAPLHAGVQRYKLHLKAQNFETGFSLQ
jgi:hypothetical protein